MLWNKRWKTRILVNIGHVLRWAPFYATNFFALPGILKSREINLQIQSLNLKLDSAQMAEVNNSELIAMRHMFQLLSGLLCDLVLPYPFYKSGTQESSILIKHKHKLIAM